MHPELSGGFDELLGLSRCTGASSVYSEWVAWARVCRDRFCNQRHSLHFSNIHCSLPGHGESKKPGSDIVGGHALCSLFVTLSLPLSVLQCLDCSLHVTNFAMQRLAYLISVVQQLARFIGTSSPMQRCTCYTKCLCVSSAKQRLTR